MEDESKYTGKWVRLARKSPGSTIHFQETGASHPFPFCGVHKKWANKLQWGVRIRVEDVIKLENVCRNCRKKLPIKLSPSWRERWKVYLDSLRSALATISG
jgi:hypothetical protein